MKWLVTARQDIDQERVRSLITSAGGACDDCEPPVPLGDDELAFNVKGPSDLPKKLQGNDAICGVYPSSDPEPY